jgi:hypothetical protein
MVWRHIMSDWMKLLERVFVVAGERGRGMRCAKIGLRNVSIVTKKGRQALVSLRAKRTQVRVLLFNNPILRG